MPRLTLAALLLAACPPIDDEPAGSTSVASTSSSATSGGSSSSGGGGEASSGGEAMEVCMELTPAAGGDVYALCPLDCADGCTADPFHVTTECVLMTPLHGPRTASVCMSLCETDSWCAKGEICVVFNEGSFCVSESSTV